jgi:hypothetical protein
MISGEAEAAGRGTDVQRRRHADAEKGRYYGRHCRYRGIKKLGYKFSDK